MLTLYFMRAIPAYSTDFAFAHAVIFTVSHQLRVSSALWSDRILPLDFVNGHLSLLVTFTDS